MNLLMAFLFSATIGGLYIRTFDWRTVMMLGVASSAVAGGFYFSGGFW